MQPIFRKTCLFSCLSFLAGLSHADVTNYCTSSPNSVGPGATIQWVGPETTQGGQLAVQGLPRGVQGLFIYGFVGNSVPFGDGVSCIGGANWILARKRANVAGVATLNLATEGEAEDLDWLDMNSGFEWNFQYMYRDPRGPLGSGFNLTDAVRVTR